jgi:hypothetical protein
MERVREVGTNAAARVACLLGDARSRAGKRAAPPRNTGGMVGLDSVVQEFITVLQANGALARPPDAQSPANAAANWAEGRRNGTPPVPEQADAGEPVLGVGAVAALRQLDGDAKPVPHIAPTTWPPMTTGATQAWLPSPPEGGTGRTS